MSGIATVAFEESHLKLPIGRIESVVCAPEDVPKSHDEWAEALGVLGLSGNVAISAELMGCFTEGRERVLQYFRSFEVEAPSLRILSEVVPLYPQAFNYLAVNELTGEVLERSSVVQQAYLEELAAIEEESRSGRPNIIKRLLSRRPSTYSIGDALFGEGVEETHHAVYYQLFPDRRPHGTLPGAMSEAEYNAQESEWQALGFQIKMAQERGVSPVNLRYLIQDRDEAARIREQQGLTLEIPYLG